MEKEFLRWQEDYSVRVKEIDEQHKKLVVLINKFYNAFYDHKHKEVIEEVLSELTDYTRYHFSTEEKYFRQFNYSDTLIHIKEHQQFIEKIKTFTVEKEISASTTTFKLMAFLQNWLINHILKSDKKYSECFIKHGLK